jgi:DNA polymerase
MTKLQQAIELRKQTSKSSTSKLDALVNRTSPDGRLRYNYRFYGAHTGRFAGEGVQPQNLPRGTVKEELFDLAVSAIRDGRDTTEYGRVLEVVSSTLRGAFRAPEGKTFIICDLSQIELRVLAWLSDCAGLKELISAADPYVEFASKYLYKTSEVSKHQRQVSKSAVLGCGFQLSGGEEKKDKNGDLVKTGLWGYAANMGIEMTKEEAHEAVRVFREAYWEVNKFWYRIEDACKVALQNDFEISCGPVSVGAIDKKLMWINLPSGRRIHYPRARLRDAAWPDGRPKTEIRYWGVDSKTKQFRSLPTYGGKLTENLCQAIARDVLAEAMLRIDEHYGNEIEIVGHSHDEVVCETESESDRADFNLGRVEACMTTPMPWAPTLDLAAKGVISNIYRK